jgi:hypothetical protein
MTTRKLGAFELLIFFLLLEAVFGSGPRALLLALLAIGFYYAKKHFGGEFSIRELQDLFVDTKKDTPS